MPFAYTAVPKNRKDLWAVFIWNPAVQKNGLQQRRVVDTQTIATRTLHWKLSSDLVDGVDRFHFIQKRSRGTSDDVEGSGPQLTRVHTTRPTLAKDTID